MLKKGLKRAEVQTKIYFMIAQLVLIAVVLLFFMMYITGIANDTLLEKNYFSRDIALLIDTAYAAPGNLEYKYPGNMGKYDFTVGFSKYKVSVGEEKSDITVLYSVMEDTEMELEYKELAFKKDEKLKIVKEGDKIKVDKSTELSLDAGQLDCPKIDTKEEPKTIVIDAGHLTEPEDLGNKAAEISEAQKTFEIAKLIKDLGPTKGLTIELTRLDAEKEIALRRQFIKDQNPNIVISLHIGEEDKISTFYASSDFQIKNQKLACLISNKLLDSLEFEFTTTNPLAKEFDENSVIMDDQVSILLEIGKISNLALFEKTNEIASAITEAIGEYYE